MNCKQNPLSEPADRPTLQFTMYKIPKTGMKTEWSTFKLDILNTVKGRQFAGRDRIRYPWTHTWK